MVHPGVFLVLLLAMAMVSEKHERILKFVPGRLEGQQSRLTVRRSSLWHRTKGRGFRRFRMQTWLARAGGRVAPCSTPLPP